MKSLSQTGLNRVLLACFILIASYFYWQGIDRVPFHPDEATQLYMSADFQQYITDPVSMAWQPEQKYDPVIHFRLLDAPLTRYAAGAVLYFTGQSPLPVDWVWSQNWRMNVNRGALPGADMLHAGRLAVAWVFPFSLLLLYAIATGVMDYRAAWISLLLFAGNALVLLHTRRVMTESFLTFFVLLNIFMLIYVKPPHLPWLGVATALAVSSKQSAAALIPLNLLAIVWITQKEFRSWKRTVLAIVLFIFLFALIFMLLNPVFWAYPIPSLLAAGRERQQLLQSQIETIARQDPDQILTSVPMRAGSLIAHTFFTPPMIAESLNYFSATLEAQSIYFDQPLHSLFRAMFAGTIYLIFTLIGLATAIYQTVTRQNRPDSRIPWLLLSLAFLAGGLIAVVPLTWQRYVMPLIAFPCIFAAWPFYRLLCTNQTIGQE